jgi:chromosome segregation ATPase
MSRLLHWFNLLGVLVVATLCILQWHTNRRLNLDLNRRKQLGLEQAAKLEAQARTSAGQSSDLASLQTHLARVNDDLRNTATSLAVAERRVTQLASERDQLKSTVTHWAAAVAARDERLKEAASQSKALAAERNDLVNKFNELAAQHNKLVKEWNELQSRLSENSKTTPPPPR